MEGVRGRREGKGGEKLTQAFRTKMGRVIHDVEDVLKRGR